MPSRVRRDPALFWRPPTAEFSITRLDGVGTGPTGGHRITIATGLADAQLQRSPVAGRIADNFLIPGLFRAADNLPLAQDNERREISIETDDGTGDAGSDRHSDSATACLPFRARQYLEAGAPLGWRASVVYRSDRPAELRSFLPLAGPSSQARRSWQTSRLTACSMPH